ncbi:MAG TPA: sigma-70 family RNA polymerase sigma factor [Longimicrobiales bacterium]|nr:sigma-70 family RNA polymerase sigma factor [Longimicrobiales bacterium]
MTPTTPSHSADEAPSRADADGFRQGFEEEALPHLEAVYRFAIRLVRGEVDQAQDLVQETYLRGFRSWASYTRGTNCRSWLFTICRNVFLRQREKRGRRPETPTSRIEANVEASAFRGAFDGPDPATPERRFFDSFIDQRILDELDGLPDEFRECVLLSDLHGLPYAEIAHILEIPVGTVKSRLHRGRRLLQSALEAYAIEMGYVRPKSAAGAR